MEVERRSKASELQGLKKRSVFLLRGFLAKVTGGQRLTIGFSNGTYTLNKDEALRLAKWITEMFEERAD